MGALLAIATFALFILIDYLLSRRASESEAHATETAIAPAGIGAAAVIPEAEFVPEPVWVAGYELPEHLHYHRGHTWARVVSPDTAVVGLDDFSRRLIGKAEGVELPEVGSYLRQGGKGAQIQVKNRAADLIAPVDGEVVEVNEALDAEPALATDDPYGRGWLFKIRSTNLAAALRNLLSGTLARRWVEDGREQLDMRLMAMSGSVLQDGGDPAHDFGEHLETPEWKGLVEKFLLTEGYERSDV
jgi:glycine cleavage system H protein